MFTSIGKFFVSVALGVASFFGIHHTRTNLPEMTNETHTLATTTTSEIHTFSTNSVKYSVKKTTPPPPPSQTPPASTIKIPTDPGTSDISQAPSTQSTEPVQTTVQQTTPTTKEYYENGSYVFLTDEQHKELLRELVSAIQDLKNKEQPYIDDFNSANSEIQKACATTQSGFGTTGTSPVAQGNAAIAAQTQAYVCSSTSQAYSVSIQVDRQGINYYESQIQSLKTAYN